MDQKELIKPRGSHFTMGDESDFSESDSSSPDPTLGVKLFDYCFIDGPWAVRTWMDLPAWWKWQVLHWVFNDDVDENGSIWITNPELGLQRVWHLVKCSVEETICLV